MALRLPQNTEFGVGGIHDGDDEDFIDSNDDADDHGSKEKDMWCERERFDYKSQELFPLAINLLTIPFVVGFIRRFFCVGLSTETNSMI